MRNQGITKYHLRAEPINDRAWCAHLLSLPPPVLLLLRSLATQEAHRWVSEPALPTRYVFWAHVIYDTGTKQLSTSPSLSFSDWLIWQMIGTRIADCTTHLLLSIHTPLDRRQDKNPSGGNGVVHSKGWDRILEKKSRPKIPVRPLICNKTILLNSPAVHQLFITMF